MLQTLKTRWALLLMLLLFVCFRSSWLSLPFFWDEAAPYAEAVRTMYHNGISLAPGTLPADLSRGHPLFFHTLAASWMHIFGPSITAMHAFSLFIACLLLVLVYEICTSFFNWRVAAFAIALIMLQPLFFVQAGFVLPEVLVALLSLAALYSYVLERLLLTALFLTAVLFTKESGTAVAFVLGCDATIRLFTRNGSLRRSALRALAVIVPVVLLVLFFAWQHAVFGWYLFPDHTHAMETSWQSFWRKTRTACMRVLFCDSLRCYYFLLLLPLAIAATARLRNWRYSLLLLPVFCIYYFVDDMRAGRLLPAIPFALVFVVVSGWFLYHLSILAAPGNQQARSFILLAGAFVIAYLCFSGVNFFTVRYIIACMVPVFIIAAICMDIFIVAIARWLYGPVALTMLTIAFFAYRDSTNRVSDCGLSAFDAIATGRDVTNWLIAHNAYDRPVATWSFLERTNLSHPFCGYLPSNRIFTHLSQAPPPSDEYVIFDNIDVNPLYTELSKDNTLHLVASIQHGAIWAEIYQR